MLWVRNVLGNRRKAMDKCEVCGYGNINNKKEHKRYHDNFLILEKEYGPLTIINYDEINWCINAWNKVKKTSQLQNIGCAKMFVRAKFEQSVKNNLWFYSILGVSCKKLIKEHPTFEEFKNFALDANFFRFEPKLIELLKGEDNWK